MPIEGKLRIAAVGDLHCRLGPHGHYRKLVEAVNEAGCDALVLCGDLTDRGAPDEAKLLGDALGAVRCTKVGVLGNHDLEAGRGEEVKAILGAAGIQILDGEHTTLKGKLAAFAGTKGFCGGFDRATLQGFGEEAIKAFVYETLREALKLEAALTQIDLAIPIRIAVLHYAPIRATCIGENPELMPFLGSSRLAEPLDSFGVTLAFHGHAHYGALEGRTLSGVPVYNVAMPLLRRADPERRVFVVDVPVPGEPVVPRAELGPGVVTSREHAHDERRDEAKSQRE